MKKPNPKQLSGEQRERLFGVMKTRFEKNMNRHNSLEWSKVQARLEANLEKLCSLHEMERTGGEPDVVDHDENTGEYVFYDCSEQTPSGRTNVCYDREALDSRKEHKPKTSAMDMATAMGIELLTESNIERSRNSENLYVAWYDYMDRKYDRAELECQKLIEMESGLPVGYWVQASVYLQTGRLSEAVAGFQKAAALSNRDVQTLIILGHALGVTGARTEGRKVLDEMLSLSKQRYVEPDFIAMVYEGLGERDRALQWFEKAYHEKATNPWIVPDPRLDPIRSDPRNKISCGAWACLRRLRNTTNSE